MSRSPSSRTDRAADFRDQTDRNVSSPTQSGGPILISRPADKLSAWLPRRLRAHPSRDPCQQSIPDSRPSLKGRKMPDHLQADVIMPNSFESLDDIQLCGKSASQQWLGTAFPHPGEQRCSRAGDAGNPRGLREAGFAGAHTDLQGECRIRGGLQSCPGREERRCPSPQQ